MFVPLKARGKEQLEQVYPYRTLGTGQTTDGLWAGQSLYIKRFDGVLRRGRRVYDHRLGCTLAPA